MIRLPSNLATLRAAWRAASDDPHARRSTPCFELKNAAGDRAKLYVMDVIGGWDLDASEFVQAVHAVTAPNIDMHVNSPGGFVYDAVSMYEALQASPANVATHIDGLAASAASFLALAGDTVEIAKAGRVMVHDAQGIGIGSPADLREFADLLDEVSNDIAGIYADKAGGTAASWRKTMSTTTWYSSSQAVDAGLADRVTSSGTSAPEDMRSQLIRARARVHLKG